MILTVPLVGEIKSFPLNETFRMSFGAPTFFLFFVIVSTNSSIFTGLFNSDSRGSISYLNGCHYKGKYGLASCFSYSLS